MGALLSCHVADKTESAAKRSAAEAPPVSGAQLYAMSVGELRRIAGDRGVSTVGVVEKTDLVDAILNAAGSPTSTAPASTQRNTTDGVTVASAQRWASPPRTAEEEEFEQERKRRLAEREAKFQAVEHKHTRLISPRRPLRDGATFVKAADLLNHVDTPRGVPHRQFTSPVSEMQQTSSTAAAHHMTAQHAQRIYRQLDTLNRQLQHLMKTDGRPLWGRARTFLELMREVVQTKPLLIQQHWGSAAILTRHLSRLGDELNDVTNNSRGTLNLERCLMNDLKMDAAQSAFEHTLQSAARTSAA